MNQFLYKIIKDLCSKFSIFIYFKLSLSFFLLAILAFGLRALGILVSFFSIILVTMMMMVMVAVVMLMIRMITITMVLIMAFVIF